MAKKEKMVFNDDREPGSSGGSRGTEAGAPGGDDTLGAYKRGGKVKKMANGGSASSRADGIAIKGKTRGKMC
jgi:hypothetical protein